MRYKLFITVCSAALISASAHAYDISYNDDAAATQADNSAGMMAANDQQQNMLAPKSLPVARDGEVIDSVGSGATEAIVPSVQNANGVSYITGGIGDEEVAEIDAQEHNFNTHIVMIATGGEYMGEVNVRILSKSGNEVLHLDNIGPYLYANLPNGAYTVEATSSSGVTESVKFTVPAKNPKVKTVISFNE